MVKQPAWAAAINSSALVPFSFSNRVLNEYGVSASTPESLERLPLPARPVPCHIALALRIMRFFLANPWLLQVDRFSSLCTSSFVERLASDVPSASQYSAPILVSRRAATWHSINRMCRLLHFRPSTRSLF